ncbi:MAG: hypothetical protein U0234_17985 [Sandaracinus sp.]
MRRIDTPPSPWLTRADRLPPIDAERCVETLFAGTAAIGTRRPESVVS